MRAFHLVVYSDARARGGAEMTLAKLLAELSPEIRVTILGVDGAVVHWLADHRPGTGRHVIESINDRSDVAGMRAHRKAFRQLRPDIVQFNLTLMSSCQWAIASALTIPGLRAIAVENSPLGTWSPTSRRLKRWTSTRLAAHVAVGERTARIVEEIAGLSDGSVRHLYHGVGLIEHEPPPRLDERPLVGTIARFDPIKGLDVLVRAIPMLDPSVRIVLIGDGPDRPELLALIDELGVADRIELRDVPWTERARDHLAGFDVFVLPSRLEGFPVTIMEAMLAGVAVVATDVGSVRESVTDGVTGRVVAPEDPAALAAAITDVLSSDDRRRAMGEAGRLRAEADFTLEATVAAYEALYAEVLAAPGSRVVVPASRTARRES